MRVRVRGGGRGAGRSGLQAPLWRLFVAVSETAGRACGVLPDRV